MNHKLGLCLAGGGVRGAAHIGANIKFDYVGGTSSRKYCCMLVCYGI